MYRRTVAFVALFGVFAMPAEALSPDVHDGDAGPTNVATAIVPGAAPSHELVHRSGPSLPHSPAPGHSTHVEHCDHSHVLSPTPLPSVAADAMRLAVTRGSPLIPASVPQRPDQRPPIA
ncbi:MAG: hypothetical protein HY084_07875 [Gemmatimonadetes bacterium]|nr:hypothetical protein [Gemmatimonadota bacterium]